MCDGMLSGVIVILEIVILARTAIVIVQQWYMAVYDTVKYCAIGI